MNRVLPSLALTALLLSAPAACAWSGPDAVVGGTVRDVHGLPQMGALVELLGPDATVVARTLTDDRGHFLLTSVSGSYQLRASSAFLLPAIRANLRLRPGARTLADLTMTAIFEAGLWLPAERRPAIEPADDWRWTLRSTANRPLLRLADEASGKGPVLGGSSSSLEHSRRASSGGQLMLLAGDGSFGEGGTHQVLTLDHADLDGDVSMLKANVGDVAASGPGPSVTVAAGLERKRSFGGETRMFASVASHPEIQSAAGLGMQVVHTAATERFALGDAVLIDAGTLFTAERLLASRFDSAPYIRVAFRPTPQFSLEYRLATDRVLQSSADLDAAVLPEEVLSDAKGRAIVRKGLHQEIVASEQTDKTLLSVAVYRDAIPTEALEGTGRLMEGDMAGLPLVVDPVTQTLRLAVKGYSASGLRVSWTQQWTPVIAACLEGEEGSGLGLHGLGMSGTGASGSMLALADVPGAVHARVAPAVRGSVRVNSKRTGTALNVGYRWEPKHMLTQVDEFDTGARDAFLGVTFRQKLWTGQRLKGVNAVVEATNLLQQGYEPVLGADGQTLYLAQVPRAVQGGLAFNF